jgi:hypothetical protein
MKMEKANKIIEKVYKICPALILGILYLTKQIQYNMVDDYVMNYISMGGHTGNPDEHLLIINVIVGYALKGMYAISGLVNWYGIMYLAIVLICTYIILNVSEKYMKLIYALGIAVIFELTLIFWLTFTVLAYVATGVATIKYVDYVHGGEYNKRKKTLDVFLIVILFTMGYMLRSSAFVTAVILTIPFLGINIRKILEKRSNIIILFATLLCIIAVYGINKKMCDNELWSSYYTYCTARSEVLDYPLDKYADRETELRQLSISPNDYKLLESWHFADKVVFSEDVLNQINGLKKINEKYNLNVIKILKGMMQTKETWIFLIVCLLFIYIDKRNIKYYLLQGGFTFGMVAATFIRNRPVLRVIVPLYILGIICMLYIFIRKKKIKYTLRKKSALMIAIAGILVLLVCYAFMNCNLAKLNKINENKYSNTLEYINRNKDKLYITDLLGTMLYNKSIKNVKAEITYDNIISFGDWAIYNSTYYSVVEKYNLKYNERLIIDLVENENVRCMLKASDKEGIEQIEKFIEEHTNRKVDRELEYRIDDEDIAVYKITYAN